MTTRAFWTLAGLTVIFALVGLATLNRTLLALALPLIVYIFVAALDAPSRLDLDAGRRMSTDRITQGSEIRVEIQVQNRAKSIAELHLAELSSFEYLHLEGATATAAALDPGETLEYAYTFQAARGVYNFPGVLARALEPFGLFETREELAAQANLLVYPQANALNALPIRPPQTKGFSGPISSRKSGAGMEFFGVRNFQLGDSLRHINWRTSARYPGSLFTNEFEQEQIADVGLILDARTKSDLSAPGGSLFEHAIQATASLAEIFLKEGHRVSLLVYSSYLTKVFPGYGKLHFEKILKSLSYVETGTNPAQEQYRYFPPRLLPPGGQLVYISPLDYTDLAYLKRLRALGYAVLVVSPNPLDFEIRNSQIASHPDFDIALRFARIERNILVRNLQGAGIPVANWNVDQPLSEVVKHAGIQYAQIQRMVRVLQ